MVKFTARNVTVEPSTSAHHDTVQVTCYKELINARRNNGFN